MDIWDHQSNAETIYMIAGADPAKPLSARKLALQIPQIMAVRRIKNFQRDGRLICIAYNEFEIHIKAALKNKRFEYTCNHEIAEWFFFDEDHEDKERACNELADALCLPKQTLLPYASGAPPDVEYIAARLEVSQRTVASRIAEIKRVPLAIVTLSDVWFSPVPFNWPSPKEMIDAVKSGHAKCCFVQQATDAKNMWFVWWRE